MQQPWSAEAILNLARGFMEPRILLTAAELDLFTLLAEDSLSVEETAARIGAAARPLAILLDALSSMELLVKQEGRYSTAPAVAPLLDSREAGSVLPMVLHANNLWSRWTSLSGTVCLDRKGSAEQNDWLTSFIGAMHVVGAPQAEKVVAAIRPGPARSLLDIGGASGTYTLAFLNAAPELHATLFDRPPVVELARKRISQAGFLERVTLVGGDFYQDPLPAGHDLAFLSAIIHQNSPEENLALYRKVYEALLPGGRLVIRDHVLSPDRTAPRLGALFAVNMLVGTAGGNSYTFEEIKGGLLAARFERVNLIQPDQRMDGLVEALKPAQT
jgi:SAM-dependent methyltransferase